MLLRELKSQRSVYHLLINLIKFDQQNTLVSEDTPLALPLRKQLIDAGIDPTRLGEIDITPIAHKNTTEKTTFFEVCSFCRIIAEYIGDYVTTDTLMENNQLLISFMNIMDATNIKKKGVSKVDVATEKEFLLEWTEVIGGILEDMGGDSDEEDVTVEVTEGVSVENIDEDGNVIDEDETEDDDETDDEPNNE